MTPTVGRFTRLATATVVALGFGGSAVEAATTPPAPPASVVPTAAPTAAPVAPAATLPPGSQPAGSQPTFAELLPLQRDGLGVAAFGTEAETAIAAVSAVLGPPTADSGWVPPSMITSCEGAEARSVEWGQLKLYFGDAPVVVPVVAAPAATSVAPPPVAPVTMSAVDAAAAVTTAPAATTVVPAATVVATATAVAPVTAITESDLGTAVVAPAAPGVRQFFGYSYGDFLSLDVSPSGLATPEGVGVGTPVAILRAAYPGVVLSQGEEGLVESTFYVDESLRGVVTGAADDGVITLIAGGNSCLL